MNENKPIIAERIKILRKDKGLTQEQLADILGLNAKSSIANYESGANAPSDEIKVKMCELFNCDMDYLMGKSDIRKITPEIRAIARDVAKLKPEKKELFKNLLKQMSDEADEASKR